MLKQFKMKYLLELKIRGSTDFQGLGASFALLLYFFIKTPISYSSSPLLKTEHFLKPNIGSRASSEKKKPDDAATVRARGKGNKPGVRENGVRKQRDGVNLIWREADSLVW